MPQSLVINLVTQSAVSVNCLQGRALQQLFFSLVDAVDSELGRVLRHDKGNRSYSLSALQINSSPEAKGDEEVGDETVSNETVSDSPSRLRVLRLNDSGTSLAKSALRLGTLQYVHPEAIAPHTECWWRISFLDDALFDHLIFLWKQLQNDVFQLGSASVKIVRLVSELPGLRWVSSCSYRDIYEQASAYERNIHLRFVTPTAFETSDGTTPLPTADAIFQPLRKSWNRYSGLVFSPRLIDSIVPINFDIQTQSVQSRLKNSLQTTTGCTGRISFRIGGQGDPLINKRINSLADFTQYCPVGLNTQFGMGVIRRVSQARIRARRSHIN